MLSTRFLQAVPLHVVAVQQRRCERERTIRNECRGSRNDTDSRQEHRLEPDAKATTEEGRITEDGTDCDARQQAESQPRRKKSTGRKSQERQSATKKQKGGFVPFQELFYYKSI
jgi:hypothetical protein